MGLEAGLPLPLLPATPNSRRSVTFMAPHSHTAGCCGRTLSLLPSGHMVHAALLASFALHLYQDQEEGTKVLQSIISGFVAFNRLLWPLAFMVLGPPWALLTGAVLGVILVPVAWFLEFLRMFLRPLVLVLVILPEAFREHSFEPLSLPWPVWRDTILGLVLARTCARVGWRVLPAALRMERLQAPGTTGQLFRAFFMTVLLFTLSVPFALTSRPAIALLWFLLQPWCQVAEAIPRYEVDCKLTALGALTMFLTVLKIWQLIYRRHLLWSARRDLDGVLQWALDHPFHAELEQNFGAESSTRSATRRGSNMFSLRSSRSFMGRSFSAISAAWNQDRANSLTSKQDELIQERRDQLKEESGGAAPLPGAITASVRRDNLWEDSRSFLLMSSIYELLSEEMKVGFKNELGLDLGGVSRDWFDSVGSCLADGSDQVPGTSLLVIAPDRTLMPRPEPAPEQGQAGDKGRKTSASSATQERLKQFIAVGRLLALAIFRETPLPLSLSQVTCKLLLRKPVCERDVRRLDPEFYRCRVAQVLRDGGLAELEEAMGEPITFLSAATDSRPEQVELKPGGAQIPVTQQNKQEYVRLLSEAHLCGATRREFQCLLQGFWEILPPGLMEQAGITPRELSVLISGAQDLDPDSWREYSDPGEDGDGETPLHEWFWDVVNDMSQEDRSLLLHFSTGSSRLPPGGFRDLKPPFRIEVAKGSNPEYLPQSHTCFNHLVLNDYSSHDELEEKLLLAVRQSEGFGFI